MRSMRLLTVFIAFATGISFSSLAIGAKKKAKEANTAVVETKADSPAEAKALSQESRSVTIKVESATEKFENVTLLAKASLNIDGATSDLSTVSHGLRKKAVFGLVPVRVYVLELLAANPAKLDKTEEGFLKSLAPSGPILLHITFLRDLPGSKISEAFKEGLESNGIKTLTPEMEQVLKEISAIKEFKKNESFSIAINSKEKNAAIYMQQTGGEIKTASGDPKFAEDFLSIWFGRPSDNRLGELKKELIK